MVTVIVGTKTDTGICRIITDAQNADEPRYVEFPAPAADKPLQPGKPAWLNYVKGALANFHGKSNR